MYAGDCTLRVIARKESLFVSPRLPLSRLAPHTPLFSEPRVIHNQEAFIHHLKLHFPPEMIADA